MLNHTNRTLSANLLGLNLGTQALHSAGVVNVATKTLCLRPSHPDMGTDLMRGGDITGPGYCHESEQPGSPFTSPSSWSFSPTAPAWRLVERPRAEVVAEAAPSKREVVVSVVRTPRSTDVAGPRAATARAAFPPTTTNVAGG